MKRTIAASAALALVMGGTFIGTAAYADDAVPEVVPEVTLEVAAAAVAPAPEPEPEPERLAICHSGSEAHWGWIAPDDSGWNGHQHHAADIVGLTEAECLAKNPAAFDAYVAEGLWLLPASWDRGVTPTYQAAIFPQDRLALDAVVPCDRWGQHDFYPIDNPADQAVYDSLGEVLDQGEDGAIYGSHEFVYGGDCAPPTVEECVAHTTTHSTDIAPAGWSGDGEWIEGGYRLTVDGAWESAWIERDVNLPIEQALAELDIDASPSQYVGLHFLTADGRWITYEEEASYGGKLWSNSAFDGVPSGMGYPAFGSPDEFVAENAGLNIAKVRVLYTHPEASSTVITSVGFGCGTYTFDVVAPPVIPEPRVVVFEAEWEGAEPTCDVADTEADESIVTQERVVTTTRIPWVLVVVAGLYELRENLEGADIQTAIETRVVTYQGEPCADPVDEEPTPTPTPTTPTTPTGSTGGLADTGTDLGGLWIALALGFVGGLIVIARRAIVRR